MSRNTATVVEEPRYDSSFLAVTSAAIGVDAAKVSEVETKPIGRPVVQETLHVAARRPLSIPERYFLCCVSPAKYHFLGGACLDSNQGPLPYQVVANRLFVPETSSDRDLSPVTSPPQSASVRR
jgi:hypothetical protein